MVVPMGTRKSEAGCCEDCRLKNESILQSQIGSVRSVLFEGEDKDGFTHGFTDNYVKVPIMKRLAIPYTM